MSDPAYVEFGVQSNFSFLRGASKPEELVVAAAFLGHAGMGLADRNTVAGVVRAWSQSKHVGTGPDGKPVSLPYHPGARLVFCDGTPDVLAYPRDRRGWGNLCRLLTQANMRDESPKGDPHLYKADLLEWGDCMSLAVLPDVEGEADAILVLLRELTQRFGKAIRLAVSPSYSGNDRFRLDEAAALARAAGMPMMATNDVLYHAAERRPLQDVLTAIRLKTTVMNAGFELDANAERHMKTPEEMARLFRDHPRAIAETVRFAGELKFSLEELKYNLPDEKTRDGATQQEELERLTWEGAAFRWPGGIKPKDKETLEHELMLVRKLGYAGYFLIVHDIVRHAREELKVLCQGRGSAANSLICYCLCITDIGPDRMDTLFERFISEERGEPPDIDVDFEHERRPEVLRYVYEKYSDKHTSLAAAVISYRGRSALREVSKAMGLSDDVQSALSGSVWGWWSSKMGEKEAVAGGLKKSDPMASHVISLANEILEFPRHLTQHVGGFVITRDRLDEIVPIVKTAMDDRKMVEWDKDDLDATGLFKFDVLALGMLSCLKRCFVLVKNHYPEEPAHSLATIKEGLPEVYDMICRADTLGVFQIESRAQMSMLPRLRPQKFYDLVIEVAIVRPGPIQGNMVHPYLRRRTGKEKIEAPGNLGKILERTLGVPLFQEQAMRIAIECAGFAPAKADKLRRAMATFRRTGTIHKLRDEFIKGMTDNDYEREFAERCFAQIEGFGEYGFPESHAASFALLVYASCWFKTFYPDVFCAAILNSQPMGFYAPAQLVRDARDHGVEIRAVDINHSIWDCTLEKAEFVPKRILEKHAEMRGVIRTTHAVRLGFRQIKGLSLENMEAFVEKRGAGYESVRDVWLRSGLDVGAIEKLAQADAFRSIGLDRRAALWQVRALDRKSAAETMPLFDRPHLRLRDNEPATCLPVMPAGEHVIHDYRALGLSLKAHPLSFLRGRLNASRVTPNERLPDVRNGSRIVVAGLVLVRQRPGKGNAIFLTLEDENGIANIIVWQRDFERLLPVIMGSKFIRVAGRLQCESGVIHIVAQTMEDLTPWLSDLSEKARSIETLARADEIKRPGTDQRLRPPSVHQPANDSQAHAEASSVMPKGRNFQ
ncbi:MAG: error-prone DNA polymerase [Mesorhizobium sp.]|nr:error-prone DNA polymerase [Mesorhizobium sp.]MBL8577780.1 error-prone DNA polymerase [Mesorhizobium sp.]